MLNSPDIMEYVLEVVDKGTRSYFLLRLLLSSLSSCSLT